MAVFMNEKAESSIRSVHTRRRHVPQELLRVFPTDLVRDENSDQGGISLRVPGAHEVAKMNLVTWLP